jgi:soluble cytochrome b562
MSISAVSGSTSTYQPDQSKMEQMKKSFDELGSALKSGNLEDAKKAFADLKKNAPSQGAGGNDPMSKDLDAVQKALDSGDVKGAQEAFSKIQEKMSQGPPAGGKPQGNQKDTVSLSSAAKDAAQNGSSSSSSTSYDKMDANEDGTVTAQERLEYQMSHAKESDSSTSNSTTSDSTAAQSLSSALQKAAAKAYA